MLRYWYVIILFLIFIVSCWNTSNDELPNTPTTGQIKVWGDNTFQYILPPQIDLFSSIYKNTHVELQFKPESECIKGLLYDSCKIIFINRSLSSEELRIFQKNNLIIQQTPIAHSAIALLGKAFQKNGLTIYQLKQILTGDSIYKVIFFRNNNGCMMFCKDSLLNGKSFGKNCFSVEDSSEFRKYLTTYNNVIGIMDYSFICDDDDKWTRNLKYFLEDTLIIPVRKDEHSSAYYPDQSNIATRDYPLTRTIYAIRRGDDFSLSAGFEAFIAGEKGQILFKKMGLVPTIDRERRIEMKPY
ncbi:MAG: hypothetical protein KatS3mg027_1116 [Bacteroidia bacterium]|nr:MAG: hypothetical protein KatS3mg027_1116 [Bacteroidia bacterium]